MCEAAGLVLDGWQRLVLDVFLAERADGRWASFEAGLLVARQNGKGAILEALELAGLYLFDEKLILHSAHEFKTAQEAFLRVKALIDNSDELRRQVSRMRTSHGEEGIELIGGARLRFVARSRSSGRGFSGDRIILDEAQELPRAAMGALLPTLSARPNPQVVYTGTVPGPTNDAEHFSSVRDRGRLGNDPSLAWIEWSPEVELEDLDDREAWRVANPALGYRISEETIERERNSLGDEEFARERLSLWGGARTAAVIELKRWAQLVDLRSQPVDPVCFAVDVTPDRGAASIATASRRPDGLVHVEVVENRKGVGWVAGRMAELAARWRPPVVMLDASGPAGGLIPDLTVAGVEPTIVTGRDMAQACGRFYDMAVNSRLRHLDQAVLNSALGVARKRTVGDAWAWARRDVTVDISPLVAVTLAVHAHQKGQQATAGEFIPRRIR